MKRRLPTILTFLSFLFFILLAVLWVRSHYGGDSLNFGQSTPAVVSHGSWGRVYRVNSIAGYLQWVADDSWPTGAPISLGFHWSSGQVPPFWRPGGIPGFWCGTMTEQVGLLGFQWDVYRGRSGLSSYRDFGVVIPATLPILARRLTIPYWFFFALTGSGAFLWLRRCWNSRQSVCWAREGRCGHCGYDLRATPDRCPECGSRRATPMAKRLSPWKNDNGI